ncbi:transcriptional regulator GbsR [Bacillus luti]|uniref:HTH-type transcriptional regulator n=1 Tax=Bacillus thuringiensis TaxID=1428 RepID=A0A4R4B3A8_BACTU|nr:MULTISPECIES: GbsR/MarR family transcriptional regulator [Bacillus cereus group]MBL3774192.1 GbsR/MarR family transcriptional regulator [Bacillus cereus]MBL3779401.1 GbsR/MarR family transcriptional regulator [Bacillus cereus]MBL3791516.1 GbsR/MarR family transcriptional regulator [Bacillus cereus]MED2037642.1 GbsR/MarR family transcriptional regulator [Bacillus wiedmannii]TCW46891.1 DNA-binding transcriptional regulator GbsR (MarR family) [Bacillus thuringiensis]
MNESGYEAINRAKTLVIESIAETMDLYGVTRSAGTLYGTMYFEDDMNLDEMRERLGMSKPSMSTSVKKLQDFDIVKMKFIKGSRKHTYIAEKDFFKFFTHFFSRKWEREVKINLNALEKSQKILRELLNNQEEPEEIKASAEQIYEQLEDSRVYYKWLQKLVDSIEDESIFEFIPTED